MYKRNYLSNFVSKFFLCLAVLALVPLFSIAQGDTPQDGCDPYDDCPLDTWVYVLIIMAGILAMRQMHKQQKLLYSVKQKDTG
ncbi:hypothetical protein [Mucilaginibacter sp.]